MLNLNLTLATGDKLYPDFPAYGKKSYYLDSTDFDDEKVRSKFIKEIEKIIRTSLEYRNFIKYLKNDRFLHYCTIFNRLPEDIINDIKVEVHHHPITLYDLVDTVLTKYIDIGKDFTRLSIAHEVMLEHYSGNIGLVPLTITAHQLAHNGLSILKKENIIGNYHRWIENNQQYIDGDVLRKVELIENLDPDQVNDNITEYFKLDHSLFIEEKLLDIEEEFS